MERINQFALYQLGQTLDKLSHFDGDVAPGQVFIHLMDATNAMARLRKGDPMPLGVSRVRAKELEDAIDGIIGDHFYGLGDEGKREFRYPANDAEKIPGWKWRSMLTTLEKFETVLSEEMRENETYYVPRRGIFLTKALVDSADDTFPRDLIPHIPEKALTEWRAGGRCLAFNLLSASGFHVARAVESQLEIYYQYFCAKPPGETLKGWFDYTEALTAARDDATDSPSEKIIAEIDQMRVDYRNPIAHPRIVLTEADARMLFANGESLIIGMAQDLAKARNAGQGALSLVQGGLGGLGG